MVTTGKHRKPWVIVSNNARNQNLDTCLGVRITTSDKPPLDSIVDLGRHDPLSGRALCDEIGIIYHDELEDYLGSLTPSTMMGIDKGMRVALAMR